MSNDKWEIKNDGTNVVSSILSAMTLDLLSGGTKVYEVENEETGKIRHVRAYNEEEVGEKISNGDFKDE